MPLTELDLSGNGFTGKLLAALDRVIWSVDQNLLRKCSKKPAFFLGYSFDSLKLGTLICQLHYSLFLTMQTSFKFIDDVCSYWSIDLWGSFAPSINNSNILFHIAANYTPIPFFLRPCGKSRNSDCETSSSPVNALELLNNWCPQRSCQFAFLQLFLSVTESINFSPREISGRIP